MTDVLDLPLQIITSLMIMMVSVLIIFEVFSWYSLQIIGVPNVTGIISYFYYIIFVISASIGIVTIISGLFVSLSVLLKFLKLVIYKIHGQVPPYNNENTVFDQSLYNKKQKTKNMTGKYMRYSVYSILYIFIITVIIDIITLNMNADINNQISKYLLTDKVVNTTELLNLFLSNPFTNLIFYLDIEMSLILVIFVPIIFCYIFLKNGVYMLAINYLNSTRRSVIGFVFSTLAYIILLII